MDALENYIEYIFILPNNKKNEAIEINKWIKDKTGVSIIDSL